MAKDRVTVAVLEERIKAVTQRLEQALSEIERIESHAAEYVTKLEAETNRESSAKDRAALRDLYNELRVAQRDLAARAELNAATDAIRKQMDYLQGAVNRMLLTVLTSLVLALITALIYDLTHR